MIDKIILVLALVLALVGCKNDGSQTSESRDSKNVARQQSQYAVGQPVPVFDWSLERQLVIELYTVRNQKAVTHSVWRSAHGMIEGDCPSYGYGVPYDTSLTNPLVATDVDNQGEENGNGALTSIEQAEPNGVFASKNTAATWVLWEPAWWTPRAWVLLAAGGLLGPAMGRVLYFAAIHYLGVARALPLASTMPLFAAVFGIGLLGERPGPGVLAGTGLIVLGCIAITYKKAGDTSWSRRHLWIPLLAVTIFSASHLFRKVGVEMVDSPLVAITVMSFSGMIFLFLIARLLPADQRPQFGRPKVWLVYTASGALNGLSVFLHFAGLNYGDLTIVTPLSAMAPIFALLLSRFVLRNEERITALIVSGTLLVVFGGAIISWSIF